MKFGDLPRGHGDLALDLGGRHGELGRILERLGYRYVNVDLKLESGVRGDAECLPFRDGVFAIVASKSTLEHFAEPWTTLSESHRVLRPGGHVVISVPFMHPFHSSDLWRYTPLGLRRLLDNAGFDIEHFEGRDGYFTAIAMSSTPILDRLRLRSRQRTIIGFGNRLDRLARRFGGTGEATAHLFFVVARAR